MEDATVLTWFKQVGESIAEGEVLAELETDKTTSELESPVAGVVKEILVTEGTDVVPGQVIARVASE
jgi:2-oxoglutarate dehydrogenase E2 component (dihydrolipoamide succinyltransferase)